MERLKVLIDKLVQQHQRNEGVNAMLITTQLLQNELLLLQKNNTPSVASKVAVVMPSNAIPVIRREPKPTPAPQPEKLEPLQKVEDPIVEEPIQKVEEFIQSVQEPIQRVEEPIHKVEEPVHRVAESFPKFEAPAMPEISEPVVEMFYEERTPEPLPEKPPVAFVPENPEHEAYLPPKPKFKEAFQEPEKKGQPVVLENHFDAIEETPTLAQYQPSKKDLKLQKEINDLIGEQKETLNDKLKENRKELAHMLKDTPIKDLRKAIGVNDRFVFVNELFRGDETMYERSIKTINGFHILPEAEYWINRELKVKLGWDDYKDSVQHFYHLVRRRFS